MTYGLALSEFLEWLLERTDSTGNPAWSRNRLPNRFVSWLYDDLGPPR